LGVALSDSQLREMLQQVDKDDNGVVDFDEFCCFCDIVPFADLRKISQYWLNVISFDTGT